MPAEPAADARRFPIRIGPRSRPILVFFGVRERNAYVDLAPDVVDVHFGFYRLRARLDNIAKWRIEGPWSWITAIGVRRGIRNGDISFDGNHKGGVRLDFKVPVKWGFLHPPRMYVTVEDLEGFGAALGAAGIPGEDARRSST